MSNNKEKEYRRRVARVNTIMAKKNISYYDMKAIKYELDKLTSNFEMNYRLNMLVGKYDLLSGNSEEAIQYFNNALDCSNSTKPMGAYYGLFKANINLNRYEDALDYLIKYDSCFNDRFNMNLYFKALYKLFELNNINIKDNYKYSNTLGFINCVKCPEEIEILYNEAIVMFENNKYHNTLNILKKIQRICESNNYSIDITHLIKIMKDIIKLNDKKIENKRKERVSSIKSDDEKKKYLIDEVNNNNDGYALVQLVYLLIRKKSYEEAFSWLNHSIDNNEKEKYIKELNNARKIVYEKINYKNNIDYISECMDKVNEYISNKDIESAVNICIDAYDKTKVPFFLYKVGEIYYEHMNFAGARKFFLKYLCEGDMLKEDCYVYLYFSTKVYNKKKAKKYSRYFNDNRTVINHAKCYEKAEETYLSFMDNKQKMVFPEMDNHFNNYLREIISSIKQGKIFRIETINKNKLMADEFALIEIYAAPYLLEQGAIALADKYYENAKNFTDDEKIATLVKKYELKRKEVSND